MARPFFCLPDEQQFAIRKSFSERIEDPTRSGLFFLWRAGRSDSFPSRTKNGVRGAERGQTHFSEMRLGVFIENRSQSRLFTIVIVTSTGGFTSFDLWPSRPAFCYSPPAPPPAPCTRRTARRWTRCMRIRSPTRAGTIMRGSQSRTGSSSRTCAKRA